MIIAISGNRSGCGKDTVGMIIQWLIFTAAHNLTKDPEYDIFCTELEKLGIKKNKALTLWTGWEFKKFADTPIKCFKLITGIDYSILTGNKKAKVRDKFIQFCETTKLIFGTDIWSKILMKSYNSNCKWIITDWRFQSEEADMLLQDTITIRVNRGHNVGRHYTDEQLDYYKFKYTIDNNGSISELIEKVTQILKTEKLC